LAAILVLLTVWQPTANAQTTTVALTGEAAPGTSDTFSSLSRPVLNDAGQTAFLGRTGFFPNQAPGIWSEGGGSLALVARSGDTAPGTSDTFSSFDTLFFNNAGQTVFGAELSSSANGIWSEGGGSLGLVVREGNAAPGTSNNFADLYRPVVNDAGQVAFRAELNATGTGIWSEGGGSLALVARRGVGTAPGTSDTFNTFFNPVLNDAGQTAFKGRLNGVGSMSDGIWSEGGGSLALVAREGTAAPGTSNNFAALFQPVINNAGQVAFSGRVNSTASLNDGIWSEGGGSLALVAREGDIAPGTSDTFFFFREPVLNDAGQTAFVGRVNSGNSTNDGIWSEGGGSLALVAREGDIAPGPGTSDFFSFFAFPVLNEAGQTAFLANLNGGTGPTDAGIWAEDTSGVLRLIARAGDLLDVDDGPGTDFRTISELNFYSDNGNGDGRESGFNNLGQLAFYAEFTDGSSGIFVSNVAAVPEPASFALTALGLLGLLATRRRRRKC